MKLGSITDDKYLRQRKEFRLSDWVGGFEGENCRSVREGRSRVWGENNKRKEEI